MHNEWIPDESIAAEEIIGLNYDNFKRTIIIPQNRFMDFIQLRDNDRTKMMKELFGLEKYDLLGKVFKIEKENDINISKTNGLLENLKDITKEAIKGKEKDKTETENRKNKLSEELDKLGSEFRLMDNTRQLFEELTGKLNDFKKLDDSAGIIQKLKEDLKKYNICILNFKNPIEKKSSLEKQLKDLYSAQEKLRSEMIKSNTEKETTDRQLHKLKQEFDILDHYKDESKEIKKIISIKKTDLEIPRLEISIEKNKINLEELLLRLNDTDKRISDHRLTIIESEKNMPDSRVLNEIHRWFDSYDHHGKSLNELKSKISLRIDRIKEIEVEKLDHIASPELNKTKIDPGLDPTSIIELLRSKTEEYEKGILSIKGEKDELLLKLKIKEFAHSLKDGLPCPVCGSPDHPEPLKIGNIEAQLEQTEQRIKNGETIIKNINRKIEKFREISIELSSEKKILEDLKKNLKEKETELKDHLSSFQWEDYSPENRELVKEKIIMANKMNDEIKKFRTDIEELEKSKKELEIKREKLTEEKLKLQNNYQGKRSEKETLQNQLTILKYEEHCRKTIDELQNWQEKSTLFIEEITEKYNNTSKHHDELKTKIIHLNAENESNEKNIVQHEKDLADLSEQIVEKLRLHRFNNIEQVMDILDLQIDTEAAEQKINNYQLEYHKLEERIKELKKQLQGKSFDKEEYEVLKKKIALHSNEISEVNKQLGALENTISDWRLKLSQKIRLTKDLDELELRKEDLKVMRSLFTASGFVKYVSMMKMQELVNYANARFRKLTRGSLSLDFNTNGSFTVTDHLNDGKKRNVKTLSGGQMFQASLSLALALASVVQKQNKTNHNFFFLDEGFGTQDAESLTLVFDTISELRKENRTVGLISHVAELREGMSTYLEVINDENTGSRIIKSWEKP